MGRLNESRIGAVIADAFAVRASTAMRSTLHAEHGAAILVGLEGEVTVTGPGGAAVRGRVVVVPPDVWHAASSPGPTLGLLYDPEEMPHVAGHARLHGGPYPLEGRLLSRLDGAVAAHSASLSRPDVLDGLAREVAAWLARESPRRAPDGRVARVLEALRDPAADRRLAVSRAGISEAHLQALFARDVGLPIRTFQLWRRLLAALVAFSRKDATSAAHAAGFADLAHFSRTCRRMLGYSPSELRSGLMK
ncbi:helix-turn-helix domain-containing protein [Sorangium sp. So ce1000]|uniref:AraC family transcriptional regulator n=1 Tax=Sorangium sp. So ce1000 TaxID=3133325 RepID=UPI003F5E2634